MEQNLPIVAKKLWHIVRVAYFMLRKGISKAKLMLELNLLLKRGKIASKSAMHNLVFHNIINHNNNNFKSTTSPPQPSYSHGKNPIDEYEFSCSNTPAHHSTFFNIPFHLKKRSRRAHALSRGAEENYEEEVSENNFADDSPALPGFGRTPMVRQLRISDSPFMLEDASEEEVEHVDEAAEEFIMRFYKDLKKQNGMYDGLGCGL